MSLDVVILDICRKELLSFPQEVREDFVDVVAKLRRGISLTMPLSKPMPQIGRGVYELRLKDRSRVYRIFYFVKKKEAIYVLHSFQKKTRRTPSKNISLAKRRIKRLL